MFSKKSRNISLIISICLMFLFMFSMSIQAEETDKETDKKIKALKEKIKEKGYSFKIGRTRVSHIPLKKLCGLKKIKDWEKKGKFDKGIRAKKEALPSSFDWRTSGKVTPVKDQGSCGSCWDFATLGSYEGAVAVFLNKLVDLSEQYLLDCNSHGYSCDGGWWVFDDLTNGIPLESCYPYKASVESCKQTCPKNYPLSEWYYVGKTAGVPRINDIKGAIYDHGPVAVAVHVNSYFQHYTGGIFDACTSGSVNHGVVLVGWNDNGKYWILKNSWGTGWGENGYMKIKYRCCKIGYAAAYGVPQIP